MYRNKIKEYRKLSNITMKELASKAGISTGYLCHLEKGNRNNPSTRVMENIAKGLGRTIAEIFFSDKSI